MVEATIPRNGYFKPPDNLKPGDHVEIMHLKQKGTVISPPDENKEVHIQVGIMKVNVHLSKLRLIKEEKEYNQNNTGAGRIGLSRAASLSTELDLRGQILDDAVMKSDKFLDDAALGGLSQVTIIHGKGTGVLRAGIQDMLKKHRHVKAYRLGRYGEGESGVTIVEIK
jgi:DNA mismatch repair protein MutS2